MSKAIATPTTSRRGLLAASGMGALIDGVGLSAAAVPATAAAQADPVLALYAKWQAVVDQLAIVNERHVGLRADFVRRYGETCERPDAWDRDPRRAELDALTVQHTELSDESTALVDLMQATPATSIEGIRCKMLVALNVWKFIERPAANIEYQDEMTVAFLRDAVRVLGGGSGA